MANLGDYLVLNASRYRDRTAFVQHEQRLTYGELNERVNRLANHLLDLGVRKGDHLGFMFYNSFRLIEIFFAALKVGAVAVPLNFRLISSEVKWCLDNADCKVFAYGKECAGQVDPVKKEFLTVRHLLCGGDDVPEGEHDLDRWARSGSAKEPDVVVGPDDRALIIFTGGTTGVPKGSLHTHGSFHVHCLNSLIATYLAEPSETALMHVPLFHIVGLGITLNFMMIGGKIVLTGETFDAREILRLIEKERVTYIVLVPPATYTRLLDVPDFKAFDTSSLTKIYTTGGFLPRSLMLRLFDAFPTARIKYGYGQSEAPSGAFIWVSRSMVENNDEVLKSLGHESPFAEVRLVDEKGVEVPVGEVGEATIRGPHIMQGYYNQPELTAQVLKDGWIYTGDLFKKDKEGFLYFVDRKKDIIKTGGENVFAPEVEGVILSHPSVEQAAVVGVPDKKFGEGVLAVVKLRPGFAATEEEIIRALQEAARKLQKAAPGGLRRQLPRKRCGQDK